MDDVGAADSPAQPPVVEGYVVTDWLGAGASAAVWRGRDRVSGEAVAIKRLYGAIDLRGRDRLRRQAAVLQVLDHPHVVRLHRLVLGDDEVVLVLALGAGGSLGDLLARRGRLSAGEVVTIGTPLAQALAAVHARGLVHGAVGARAVLFTAEGRPMWSDLGLASAIGASADLTPTAADDVYDLGVLLADAVVGVSRLSDEGGGRGVGGDVAESLPALDAVLPPRLASVITAACDPDPEARPSAAELAVMLYDAAAAAPVRMAPPAEPVPEPVLEPMSEPMSEPMLAPSPSPSPEPRSMPEVAPREVPDVVMVGSPSSLRPLAVPPRRIGHRRRRRTAASPRLRRARTVMVAVALATSVLLAVGGWRWWWPPGTAAPSESAPTATAPMTIAATVPDLPTRAPATLEGPATLEAPATSEGMRTTGPAAEELARLDAKRSLAYATGDAALLRSLYTDPSPAGQADLGNLERMVAAGERAQGFQTRTISARVLASSTDVMRLAVIDTVPAFDVVRLDGSLIRVEPGRGERAFQITLNRVEGRWLYTAVQALDASAGT